MALGVGGAWASKWVCGDGTWIIAICIGAGCVIGVGLAKAVSMLQMPQMVGLLNAFGGLASALEAVALFVDDDARYGPNGFAEADLEEREGQVVVQSVAMYLSLIVGSVTFFGSIVACLKLNGNLSSGARIPPCRAFVNFFLGAGIVATAILADWYGYGDDRGLYLVLACIALSAIWGVLCVMAIGGADMPVVICVLNTARASPGSLLASCLPTSSWW